MYPIELLSVFIRAKLFAHVMMPMASVSPPKDPLIRSVCPSGQGIQNVLRHTGVGCTLPLSETTVATDTAGEVQLTGAGTRVHGDGLADDQAIGDQLADGLAGVGVGDLVDLVGVEPDLALAAAEDISREALLSSQVDPMQRADIVSTMPHFSLIGTC